MFPAALTRLYLTGLLALAPLLACAQIGQPFAAGQADLADDVGDMSEHSAGVLQMQYVAPPMESVRKLSDSELTCAQIYAETQSLEKTGKEQQAIAAQAQHVMTDSQNEMMKRAGDMQGGGMGSAIAGGLLGMIPGAGLVSSYAMEAAASARRTEMQESTNKMMQTQTQLINTQQALQHTQARSDHLADLFLKKGCKLSQVKAATNAAQ